MGPISEVLNGNGKFMVVEEEPLSREQVRTGSDGVSSGKGPPLGADGTKKGSPMKWRRTLTLLLAPVAYLSFAQSAGAALTGGWTGKTSQRQQVHFRVVSTHRGPVIREGEFDFNLVCQRSG